MPCIVHAGTGWVVWLLVLLTPLLRLRGKHQA
jgi:hypothetical protein